VTRPSHISRPAPSVAWRHAGFKSERERENPHNSGAASKPNEETCAVDMPGRPPPYLPVPVLPPIHLSHHPTRHAATLAATIHSTQPAHMTLWESVHPVYIVPRLFRDHVPAVYIFHIGRAGSATHVPIIVKALNSCFASPCVDRGVVSLGLLQPWRSVRCRCGPSRAGRMWELPGGRRALSVVWPRPGWPVCRRGGARPVWRGCEGLPLGARSCGGSVIRWQVWVISHALCL
jgi:hypothetical protein